MAISTAGDVNGDRCADIIIGAPKWEDGETEEGAAWIYHGGDSGVNSEPARYLQGNLISANFGASVSFAGDVNNDEYSDVIIGAESYNNGQTGGRPDLRLSRVSQRDWGTENWKAESNHGA